jgi:hypothetical protein
MDEAQWKSDIRRGAIVTNGPSWANHPDLMYNPAYFEAADQPATSENPGPGTNCSQCRAVNPG